MNQHKLPYWYHLISVLLAFIISTGAIFCIVLKNSYFSDVGGVNIPNIINFLGGLIGCGLVGCLLFLPILLLISILNWGMAHQIKYFISFLLITAYGVLTPLLSIAPLWIPIVILFFIPLIWLTRFFSRRHLRKFTQK